jgi:hypothetical protein
MLWATSVVLPFNHTLQQVPLTNLRNSLLARVAEAIVEKDRVSVFSAAGAITSGQAEEAGQTSSTTCMICMDDIKKQEDGLTMSCSHTFCKGCWLGYFQVMIKEGRACDMMCMAYKCGAICNQPCASSVSCQLHVLPLIALMLVYQAT